MACWDWPTLGLFGGVLIVWAAALTLPAVWGPLALLLLILALTLHSSLSHELLHGHPFGAARAETALGLWQPGLFVPYLRFKRTHLAHHKDANLTDPYDDPESAYLDPAVWAQLPRWRQVLLGLNNTLAGRIVLGPVVGMLAFVGSDIRAARAGDHQITRDWLAHIPGVLLTLWAVYLSPLSVWLYLLACYGALGMLKIRTFLEHQAHARTTGRTAIVEDAGLLGFLFLNNNLHVIHHMHPQVAWYKLWPLYRANRARYIARNGGYVFRSYRVIFRQYLWRVKEPVAHPLWRPRGD
jgi:fatty acid desaturase